MYLLGGVPTEGCAWPGDVPAGGVCVLAQLLPCPVNRMTDRCKNITLPQTSFALGKKAFNPSKDAQIHRPA